jgi:WD repeat-containing protein 23
MMAQVFQTLVRCYFSPAAGTGQRYIISGSHDGAAVIYDLLSAEPVTRLQAHVRPLPRPPWPGWGGLGCFTDQGLNQKRVVRDVAWHPHQPRIVTTSWDGTLREWVATPDVTPMLLE